MGMEPGANPGIGAMPGEPGIPSAPIGMGVTPGPPLGMRGSVPEATPGMGIGAPPGTGVIPGAPPGMGAMAGDPPGTGVIPGDPPGMGAMAGDPPGTGVIPGAPPGMGLIPGAPPGTDVIPGAPPGMGLIPGAPPGAGDIAGATPEASAVCVSPLFFPHPEKTRHATPRTANRKGRVIEGTLKVAADRRDTGTKPRDSLTRPQLCQGANLKSSIGPEKTRGNLTCVTCQTDKRELLTRNPCGRDGRCG